MPPRRSSRAASASQTPGIESRPIKRKRGQTLEPHNVELEEEEDVEAKPKRGKRGPSVVKPSRSPRRSSRGANASLETALVESLPIEQKRGPSIPSHILEEEEMKSEEEEEVDANLKRVAPIDVDEEAPTARKAKVMTKKSNESKVIEDSDDDSDIQAPPVAQPRSRQHNGAADAAHVVNNSERQPSMPTAEEDLEEKSLFDPLPMPGPSNLLRTIPEEPAGPKSRLVIHKMVLINFKSYAGRQEIGPFHKVINVRQLPAIKVDIFQCPVILVHCGSQWIRKIQYHRCSLICIRISCLEDEAGQDIRTHPHFCKFPRP